jgi:superfamily I DNA and/or RNA helicase
MLVRALAAGKKVRTLVVDEAAQAPEAHTLMCLQPFVEHAVFVGDPKQLGGVVLSKLCAAHHFGRSLFERLQSIGHTACLLSEQYRMHPAISAWPSATFYGGRVVDGVSAEQRVI